MARSWPARGRHAVGRRQAPGRCWCSCARTATATSGWWRPPPPSSCCTWPRSCTTTCSTARRCGAGARPCSPRAVGWPPPRRATCSSRARSRSLASTRQPRSGGLAVRGVERAGPRRADAARRRWRPDVTQERYLERCRLKTASLFAASCRLGALFGGGPRWPTRWSFKERRPRVPDARRRARRVGPGGHRRCTRTDLLDGTVTLPLILARTRDPALLQPPPRADGRAGGGAVRSDRRHRGARGGTRGGARARGTRQAVAGRIDLPPQRREALELVADGVVERYA